MPVQRVIELKAAGTWRQLDAVDRIVLEAGERQRRRAVLTAEQGTTFLVDFDRPAALHDGDGLVLEDGSIVAVAGAPEALVEILTRAKPDVVRLAWHIGNRHADLEVIGHKLRIRRDHVLEEMLRGLGADLTEIEVPFDPVRPDGGNHGG